MTPTHDDIDMTLRRLNDMTSTDDIDMTIVDVRIKTQTQVEETLC